MPSTHYTIGYHTKTVQRPHRIILLASSHQSNIKLSYRRLPLCKSPSNASGNVTYWATNSPEPSKTSNHAMMRAFHPMPHKHSHHIIPFTYPNNQTSSLGIGNHLGTLLAKQSVEHNFLHRWRETLPLSSLHTLWLWPLNLSPKPRVSPRSLKRYMIQ